MRWKIEKYIAKEGDTRSVRKFALLPTKVFDIMVWLEHYESRQMCRWSTDGFGLHWVETNRYIW